MVSPLDFTKVDWYDVLPRFGIDESYLKKRIGPCPMCAGKTRFSFHNKQQRGNYYCHVCGGGNGLNLIRGMNPGMSDKDILEGVREAAGLPGESSSGNNYHYAHVQEEMSKEESERNRKFLEKARRGSKSLNGQDPASLYLLSRVPGLDLTKVSKDIRWHPSMKYSEADENDKYVCKGWFPAMLAKAVDGQRNPITLHRTYLTRDGRKAPVSTVKKQMSGVRHLGGAAIRLLTVEGSRVLGVCEGIETGYSIAAAYRYRINVWSLLNAGNLSVADIPAGMFDEVIIFADHDKIDPKKGYRPGEHYAKLLQAKLMERGIRCTLKIPPKEGEDFNDVWVAYFNHRLAKQAERSAIASAATANLNSNLRSILLNGTPASGASGARRIARPPMRPAAEEIRA